MKVITINGIRHAAAPFFFFFFALIYDFRRYAMPIFAIRCRHAASAPVYDACRRFVMIRHTARGGAHAAEAQTTRGGMFSVYTGAYTTPSSIDTPKALRR